ncbi:MAG: hypothetical protein COV67_14980 [Nitrospinae bacterium CG11_big_fil_rev_8_21_14_0_20_56_8]|nr:MAG: hypothetical protein COV67_14980 [Nitrospinae bacterium CG11_big_fil_rev_8_21_14_0_20_56_8]
MIHSPTWKATFFACALWGLGACFPTAGHGFPVEKPIHHQLHIQLDPLKKTAHIQDRVTLVPGDRNAETIPFLLHNVLSMGYLKISAREDWSLKTVSGGAEKESGGLLTRLELSRSPSVPWPKEVVLEFDYTGPLYDPMRGWKPGRKLRDAPETREGDQGMLLSGASYFYPQVESGSRLPHRVTFHLTVELPESFNVVSQGRLVQDRVDNTVRTVAWETADPMEEILLVADRFFTFHDRHGSVDLYAYLLKDDPGLAQRYLDKTKSCLDLYEDLIAPYPYPKFALVENSYPTGYGMPSFTLLGSRIIRFPFILDTSYPHEILHNWWGNGVYVDPNGGNWSEGLTTYLADHLAEESRGQGSQYRFRQLMKFRSFVNRENDFPLTQFRSREDQASQAVGYGKTLMLFHMLRRDLGDEVFLQGLRHFYKTHRFGFAGFRNLREAFESTSGKSLEEFFKQWTERTGGPGIELQKGEYAKSGERYDLKLVVRQTQEDAPFSLRIPVAIWLDGQTAPVLNTVENDRRTQSYKMTFPAPPIKVLLDPYNDLFRLPGRHEMPPNLGQIYGDPRPARLLPTVENQPDVLLGYQEFAMGVTGEATRPGPLLTDDSFTPLPSGGLWILGRQNRFVRHLLPQLAHYGVHVEDRGITLSEQTFPWENHSFVFVLNRPGKEQGTVAWVIADNQPSISGLLRKLPHYSSYGFLVFEGEEPVNIFRGEWPREGGALMRQFRDTGPLHLPARKPLTVFKTGDGSGNTGR